MTLISSIRLDLLELFGRRYVWEHCMSAFNQMQEEKQYRIYVTDCLKILTGGTTRYADWIDRKPKDTRTFEEINEDVWSRIMGA